jgi:hypothetical protein
MKFPIGHDRRLIKHVTTLTEHTAMIPTTQTSPGIRTLQDKEIDEVAGGQVVIITCTTNPIPIILRGDTWVNPWLGAP